MSNPYAKEFTKKLNLVFFETILWVKDIHLRRFPIETGLNEKRFLLKFRHSVKKQTNEPWSSACPLPFLSTRLIQMKGSCRTGKPLFEAS